MHVSELQERMAGYMEAFARDGFLVLPKFFSDDELAPVQVAIEDVKHTRPLDVVIDSLETGERTVLGLLTPERIWGERMKINDLYLLRPEMRELALAPGLVRVLWALLGRVPALCNSLYLEKGSAQRPHVDALYMTPRTQGHLIASWVALEDVHAQAGPLEYVPGSHRIAQMKFSDGSYHEVNGEAPLWQEYMASQLAGAGLETECLLAAKGDVFIWHAHLLHGGAAITDAARTRKSCVFHYFSQSDALADNYRLVPQSGACWIDRAPQPLPLELARRLPFSEAAYLKRHPDVAAAVRAGGMESGAAHYEQFGRQEGRLPC